MNYHDPNRPSDNLNAVQASAGGPGIGATIEALASGPDPALFGVTLVAATRYVFPFGADKAPVPALVSVVTAQLRWATAIAFTATIEECLFPALWPSEGAYGIVDVADHALTPVGSWIPIKPPDAYVEVVGGGGYDKPTGVITVAAAQPGGCTINLSAWGGRRARINMLVGATGGLVRFALNGKAST